MPLRRILLRVLLGSLAIAAVGGAGAVLLADAGATWRIASTALWTAACAGLMLGCSLAIDRPKARLAGMAGMSVVVVEYLIVLALIWSFPPRFAGGLDWEELLFYQAWFVPLCAAPAVICLRMVRTPVTALAGWVGTTLSIATLILLTVGTMAEVVSRSSWGDDGFELAGALGILGPLAVLSVVGAGTGDRRHWRWLGVALAAVGFLGASNAIVRDISNGDELFLAVVAASAVVAHANILLVVPLPAGGPRWLAYATVAAGAACGGGIALISLMDWMDYAQRDMFVIERIASAAAVLAGCGTLAVAVLSRIYRRVDLPASLAVIEVSEIAVTCPICRKRQSISASGGGRCAGCGLIIRVRLEEPRCATCDYSLRMFAGDRCPECGTAVPRDLPPESSAFA